MRYLLLLMLLLGGCAHLPVRGGECPSSHPIKGNADSGYYHRPTDTYYKLVKAEKCFRTPKEAAQAGFRSVNRHRR